MIRWASNLYSKRQKGQSLVEVALFLPIFIFIIAGVVEVSNMLNTQNKIQTSSRIAAGYGAANFDRDDWAGTAGAMGDVALNTVTETLEIDENLWDLWSVRALVNDTGDDFEVFSATHVFGNESVVSASEWITIEAQVKADMLAELQSTGIDTAVDLEVVASVPFYNTDTILGLPIWQWTGLQRQRGLTVMRVGSKAPNVACPILPIAVRLEQFSLYPTNWWIDEDAAEKGPSMYNIFDDTKPIFPEPIMGPQQWNYPNPPPIYNTMVTTVTADAESSFLISDSSRFWKNDPGVPLWMCKQKGRCNGNIYWAREQVGGAGNFGWLSWDGAQSAAELKASLNPANGGNFLERYPDSDADEGLLDLTPYTGITSGDTDDKLEPDDTMEPYAADPQGEWIEGSAGNVASTEPFIRWYVDQGGGGKPQPVTIIVFDTTNALNGSKYDYHAVGFVTVNLVGFSFQGPTGTKWIIFEFLNWGSECLTKAEGY
jgi:hypothetical protein